MIRRVALMGIIVLALAPIAHAFCFGDIHVHLYRDVNQNGLQDAGEPGLGGIVVTLDQNADGVIESTATTDGNGDVVFHIPDTNVYRVRVVAPPATAQTSPNPMDFRVSCLGTTAVSIGLVQNIPAMNGVALGLMSLALAMIAVVAASR